MFLDLKLFLPDFYMDRVEDINLEKLKELGFEYVILDLDNTLVGWRSREMSDSVKGWIERALSLGMKLCIVSNCLLHGRVRFFADMLGIPFVFRAVKPGKTGGSLPFSSAASARPATSPLAALST